MKRFRIQENVPDTYPRRSRDFQVLCDLFDLINNGVKFDIDTITSTSDTSYCRDTLLTYLQHKLGLYMNIDLTNETLRTILKCFPYIVKHKGSRIGVVEAVCLFLTTLHSDGEYEVEVINTGNDSNLYGEYIVLVKMEVTQQRVPNIDILDQILKYILPSGYAVEYDAYISPEKYVTKATTDDKIRIVLVNDVYGSSPWGHHYKNTIPNILGGIGTTLVRMSRKEVDTENIDTSYVGKDGYKVFDKLK